MTTQLLDARTSQNASYANSISVTLPANTQQLFGQIGLNVPSTTPGIIRAQLEGTVTINLPGPPKKSATVTVTIVRGTLSTDHLVYTASVLLAGPHKGPRVITVTASDYTVPAPISGLLIYTMFVSSDTAGVLRVGPESFNGAAYTD